jgi:hypothetical protein
MFIYSTAGNYIADSGASAIVLPANDAERWITNPDRGEAFDIDFKGAGSTDQMRTHT